MKRLNGSCGCLASFKLEYDNKTFIEPEFCPFCAGVLFYDEEEENE